MAIHELCISGRRGRRVSRLLWSIFWSNFDLHPNGVILTPGGSLTIKLIHEVWNPSQFLTIWVSSLSIEQRKLLHVSLRKVRYGEDDGGSWRLLRLSTMRGAVRVTVDVIQHWKSRASRSVSRSGYRDEITLRRETTFGNLSDALLEMMHRQPFEHFKICRAVRSPTRITDVTDALCIRGDSRERVAAVVLWTGGQSDDFVARRLYESRDLELCISERREWAEEEELELPEFDFDPVHLSDIQIYDGYITT